MNAACLMDAAGKLTAVLGIARDITERKRAEQAEREHRERLRDRSEERRVGKECRL